MKRILYFITCAVASLAFAQNTPKGPVTKNPNTHEITEDLKFGSGRTLSMLPGSTLNLTGASIIGATLTTPNIGAATGTSLGLTGNITAGMSGSGTSRLDVRFANTAVNNGSGSGAVFFGTSDAQGADIGGTLLLGGSANLAGEKIAFGSVSGRKANSTALNFAGYLQFATNNASGTMAERARITDAGNFLLGITTDGTGKLQLANHTTSAGGIAFGTDVFLHRSGSGTATLTGSLALTNGLEATSANGTEASLAVVQTGQQRWRMRIAASQSALTFRAVDTGVDALQLSTGGNAVVSGNLTVGNSGATAAATSTFYGGGSSGPTLAITNGAGGGAGPASLALSSAGSGAGTFTLTAGATGVGDGSGLHLYSSGTIGRVATIARDTGDLTYRGNITVSGSGVHSFGNRVQLDAANIYGKIIIARTGDGSLTHMGIQGADAAGTGGSLRLFNNSGTGTAIDITNNSEVRINVNTSQTPRLTVSDTTTTVTNNLTVSGATAFASNLSNPTLFTLSGNGASSGFYTQFADASIGGQGFGAAYLRWTRDNSLGRTFSVHPSNSAGTTVQALAVSTGGISVNENVSVTRATNGLASIFTNSAGTGWVESHWVVGARTAVVGMQDSAAFFGTGTNHPVDIRVNGLAVSQFTADGLAIKATSVVKGVRTATTTWDPSSIVDGAITSATLTVTGAAVGDPATASLTTIGALDIMISAHVQTANTVRVVILNKTGAPVDLASGTLRVAVTSF